jgi:phosphoglycolate phosphatase-like HAD superfamily hydrolase
MKLMRKEAGQLGPAAFLSDIKAAFGNGILKTHTMILTLRVIAPFFKLTMAIAILFVSGCKPKEAEHGRKTETIDSLPSWHNLDAKRSIIEFVKASADSNSPSFVPPHERIAVFDNDGTLWSEQPLYFQLAFAIDQVKALAPEHPEWKTKQPFKAVLEGDMKTLMAGGEKALAAVIFASHAGMTTEVYQATVQQWMATATHPKTGRHYNEMIYLPMVELLQYLRDNEYKTFIVSGGGIDFMRAWAEAAYGIPPYQVIGSSAKYQYVVSDSNAALVKMAELDFIDDKEGKPVGIIRGIGKRPLFAAGNSDGDYQMLQYTTMGKGPRFGMIIHHTDSIREWAYDRTSSIGRLEKGLLDANKYGWVVVDMQRDWKNLYPGE